MWLLMLMEHSCLVADTLPPTDLQTCFVERETLLHRLGLGLDALIRQNELQQLPVSSVPS